MQREKEQPPAELAASNAPRTRPCAVRITDGPRSSGEDRSTCGRLHADDTFAPQRIARLAKGARYSYREVMNVVRDAPVDAMQRYDCEARSGRSTQVVVDTSVAQVNDIGWRGASTRPDESSSLAWNARSSDWRALSLGSQTVV